MPSDLPAFDCEEHGHFDFAEGVVPYCPGCAGEVPPPDDPTLEAKP